MPFPRPLSDVVQHDLAIPGLAERLREAEIWRIWSDVVGTTLSCRARPVRIINGTLTVAVSSAPWMQELRFMTGLMKTKLNDRLGAEVVKEIVLRAGRVDVSLPEAVEVNVSTRALTGQQQELIHEQAALIEDPETRQALIDLMRTSMERQL